MITDQQWSSFLTHVRFALKRYALEIHGQRVLWVREGKVVTTSENEKERVVYDKEGSVCDCHTLSDLFRKVKMVGVTLEDYRNGSVN